MTDPKKTAGFVGCADISAAELVVSVPPGDMRPRRGRPRGESTDEDILDAARALLAEGGYEAMSFEAVAQRAKVSRPTIYRRWPTRVHLANEIANGPGVEAPVVDAESDLRAEIEQLIIHLFELYDSPAVKAANAGVVMALQQDEQLRAELHTPREMKARLELRVAVRKGKDRGIVGPNIDADAIFDAVCGAIIFRTMISSLPAEHDTAENLFKLLMGGVESHGD